MRGARGRGLFQRQPARIHFARADSRPVSQTAQSDMQRRRAKTRSSDLGQILQLEKYLCVSAVPVAVNDCFAFFIVFGQRPWRDALHKMGPKARAAVRIKHVAGFRFIKDRPNFQALAEFPAATVQHSSTPKQLGWLALVFTALAEKVYSFLARYFQADRFESSVHSF